MNNLEMIELADSIGRRVSNARTARDPIPELLEALISIENALRSSSQPDPWAARRN